MLHTTAGRTLDRLGPDAEPRTELCCSHDRQQRRPNNTSLSPRGINLLCTVCLDLLLLFPFGYFYFAFLFFVRGSVYGTRETVLFQLLRYSLPYDLSTSEPVARRAHCCRDIGRRVCWCTSPRSTCKRTAHVCAAIALVLLSRFPIAESRLIRARLAVHAMLNWPRASVHASPLRHGKIFFVQLIISESCPDDRFPPLHRASIIITNRSFLFSFIRSDWMARRA